MNDRIDILVAAGMIERKLDSKVLPLVKSDRVQTIYLVRRGLISGDKIKCFAPRGLFRFNMVLSELYRVFAIIYILVKYRPAVVIGIGLIAHGIYTNVMGTIFRKKRILLLMGNNDLALTDPHNKLLQWILLRIAFLSDFIGTRGTRSRAFLIEKGFDAGKVFIPHNVFDFQAFAPRQADVRKYDMIYVGLLKQYKRIDLLIGIAHRLVHQQGLRDIQLAIVGDGGLKGSLQSASARLDLDAHIHFLPPGDAAYVCNLLNQSRLFVMTSQGEGLPMAMIEAMSCGLPVILFDHADVGDVVRHGENGFLIEPGDLDGFAEAAQNLLEDKELYEKLSAGALAVRKEYKEAYSPVAITATWERILTKCQRQGHP
jgi:glycosyltransferase involved in cell wall biosynthesis